MDPRALKNDGAGAARGAGPESGEGAGIVTGGTGAGFGAGFGFGVPSGVALRKAFLMKDVAETEAVDRGGTSTEVPEPVRSIVDEGCSKCASDGVVPDVTVTVAAVGVEGAKQTV